MRKKLFTIAVSVCLIVSGMTFGLAAQAGAASKDPGGAEMKKIVNQITAFSDGEKAFDYLSYTYMGWRTTGGKWQNNVITEFIPERLKEAGYTWNGEGTTPLESKSDNDKSADHSKDFAWVTNYDVDYDTWDPEYARLEITSAPNVAGKNKLIERIEGEYAGFDPTSEAYKKVYGKKYGIQNPDDMWKWITKKDANGKRVNVENGLEAELNGRCHLAWQTCFTDAGGTDIYKANGVEGEVIYVGGVSGNASSGFTCSKLVERGEELKAKLQGKAILSDAPLRNTWNLAQWAGGVAAMSVNSLANYSLPRDEFGKILEPFNHSARYASGNNTASSKAQMATGKPIVGWQFSYDQKEALIELLEKSEAKGAPVVMNSVSIGDIYAMNDASYGGKGQAVTIAEVKGKTKPDERVLICAHVQEPGANDNATGVGCLTEMAMSFKKAVDEGKIERPERTVTFLWGDEMNMARYWLDSHPEEKANLIMSLDMDMTGEDPEKTGGVMRVEKTPDPSAKYLYTLDLLPWEKDVLSYDETYKSVHEDNDPGSFVRLPDSHTLWGAGGFGGLFQEGYYLNDLYISAGNAVIAYKDSGFKVDVCPYEGGSDHTKFLEQNVPALLTWHFTDYTYHSSVDTLAMSSAREMENVNVTTLATGLMTANATDNNPELAKEIIKIVRDAAINRISNIEKKNTENHLVYTKGNDKDAALELDAEREVLDAWGDWYDEAVKSVAKYLLDSPTEDIIALQNKYAAEVDQARKDAKDYAYDVFNPVLTDAEKAAPSTEKAMNKADAAEAEANAAEEAAKGASASKDAASKAQAAAKKAQDAAAIAQKAVQDAEKNVAAAKAAGVDTESMEADLAAAKDKAAKAKAKADAAAGTAKAAADKIAADEKAKQDAEKKAAEEAAKYADIDKITPSDATIAEAKTDKKLEIASSSITTSANTGKKTMTVKWKKVKGATNYRIAYKKAGAKTWTYKWSAGKNSVVLTKMKNKGLYEFKLQAVKKAGSTWTKSSFSKSNYSYYARASAKASAGKKSVTVKAEKVKGATGYQVLYSTKKNMKGAKIKYGKKPTVKVSKLKKGKKYYVQVRTVKKYKGKTYVGILSAKTSAKAK